MPIRCHYLTQSLRFDGMNSDCSSRRRSAFDLPGCPIIALCRGEGYFAIVTTESGAMALRRERGASEVAKSETGRDHTKVSRGLAYRRNQITCTFSALMTSPDSLITAFKTRNRRCRRPSVARQSSFYLRGKKSGKKE